ncbi:MAG: hypothetical protein AABO58_16710 [Acidobacteriota bacterium]
MSDKWTAVKRLVESEIDKAKKFVGKAVEEFHHPDGGSESKRSREDHGCSDTIPTPCWLPEDLGDLTVEVEAGGAAHLAVRIRNTDGQQQPQVTAQVTGAGSQYVTPTSASAVVGPYGHATFNFTVTVPQQTAGGTYIDVQIVVQGCRRHILNWRVDVVEKCEPDAKTSHEVGVCDGVDPVHHWYDDFYCRRQCPPHAPTP